MNIGLYVTLIGQILGIVAVILGFVSFQVSTAKKLLAVQTAACTVFCLHYLLIGATSAFVLNAVGIVRNVVYYHRNKRELSGKGVPILFAVIMAVLGVFSWQGIYSLLVIVGLVINTVCLSFKNPQNIRKSILVSSPLVLLYDVCVLSVGGIIYESVAIISAVIGMVRTSAKHSDESMFSEEEGKQI